MDALGEWWTERAWASGLVAVVLGLIFVGLTSGATYLAARGQPVEQVRVVSVVVVQQRVSKACAPPGFTTASTWPLERVTVTVERHRTGYPDTFVIEECPGDSRVGESIPVIRANRGGEPDILGPPRLSVRDVALDALTIAGGGFVLVTAAHLLWRVARRRWHRWVASAGPSREGG